jgi:predicted TIM-barrel fold metal-dependent hydrolase
VSAITALGQSAPPRIIDCHVHHNGDPGFLQKLLARLDSANGMAFLLVLPADLNSTKPFIDQHASRLVGFGSIDPDDPHAIEQIDQFHAAGFRGLGELENPRKNYNDPGYWPLYARAEQHGMIILFHTGISARNAPRVAEDVSVDRQRVTALDGIARHFPGLTLIGAHIGNPEYAFAAEIGRWNPNVYFDLSGSSLIKLQNDYPIFKSIFWWSGVESLHTPKSGANAFEKLVFGSDVFDGDLTEFDRALDRYHKMLDACDVPQKAQDNIFGGTLWRVLHPAP